jgi:AcrR family transcriptional regulator
VSPRRSDPAIRTALIDAAARLLAQQGPQTLSTRRIAAETGTSTMAVYTHFGSMSGLVREIVTEGFLRLQGFLTRVAATDDPVADMALLGRAYRQAAVANANLYAVMFGGESVAGFELTEEDRQHGRYAMVDVIECAGRCLSAGRFAAADPALITHQMWIATHGLVTLEIGGYLIEPCDADRCFEAMLVGLLVGAGDSPDAATVSVKVSARRFNREVLALPGAPGNHPGRSG